MEGLHNFEQQKTAISEVAKDFLQTQFSLLTPSIKILLDQGILVIQAENFICPAEIRASADQGGAALIHEAYTRLFNQSKEHLVEQTEKIIGKKIISDQIGINFVSRDFLITFFLGK